MCLKVATHNPTESGEELTRNADDHSSFLKGRNNKHSPSNDCGSKVPEHKLQGRVAQVNHKYGDLGHEKFNLMIPVDLEADQNMESNYEILMLTDLLIKKGVEEFIDWLKREGVYGCKAPLAQSTMLKSVESENCHRVAGIESKTTTEGADALFADAAETINPRFACPYYIKDPFRHHNCLKEIDLEDIWDVEHHLCEAHCRPWYCPICRQIFAKASDRDSHVRLGSCSQRPAIPFEGLSEYQTMEITLRIDSSDSDEQQWYKIWNFIFERDAPPASPYLPQTATSMVWLARKYWVPEGRDRMLSLLESEMLKNSSKENPRELETLQNFVLEGLIDELLKGI